MFELSKIRIGETIRLFWRHKLDANLTGVARLLSVNGEICTFLILIPKNMFHTRKYPRVIRINRVDIHKARRLSPFDYYFYDIPKKHKGKIRLHYADYYAKRNVKGDLSP